MLNLCYINFEILFDFKSLLFSILKKDHPDLDLSYLLFLNFRLKRCTRKS